MAEPIRTNPQVILAKIESVYGTDPTPAVTDAIVCGPLTMKRSAEQNDRQASGATLSKWPGRKGVRGQEFSFSADLRGLGSAYGAAALPELDPLYRACGLAATVVATPGAETVTYAPASSAHESCTVYAYEGGLLHKFTGCRGSVKFIFENGKCAKAEFNMKSQFAIPVDAAMVTPTYDDVTVLPPVALGVTITVGGSDPVATKAEFDLGVVTALRKNMTNASGYDQVLIVDRDVRGSVDPEAVLMATRDDHTPWLASTLKAISLLVGSTQYNKVTVAAPKAEYIELADEARDSVKTYGISFACRRNTGDDEITITYN